MYFLKKASIKRKQTLIVMLTSGVALLLACVAFSSYEVITFHVAMVDNLSTLAQIIGNNSSAALDFSDPKAAKETLSGLQAEPNIKGACIYTNNGEIFASYKRPHDAITFAPGAPKDDRIYFTKDSLQLYRRIVRDGETIGTVYVVSDLNILYSRLHQYTIIAVGVFVASGMVAFLLATWLQRLISGPISSLMQTAHSVIVEKNYSVRAVKESEDELGVLIDAFNEMLTQIEVRDADLKQSHIELEKRVADRTKEVINSLSLIRATLEATTDGILVTNGKFHVTSFNEKFIEMWQISKEIPNQGDERKLLEQVSLQLKEPKNFISSIDRIYADPEKESFGLVEFKDKKVFELFSKPQRVEEKCVGRVWCFRDITDRRRAEEQLERLSDEYKAVLNSLGEGVHWLGGDGQIKFENPVAAKLLGYEVSELIGKPAHGTMHHSRVDGSVYPVNECPIYATLNDGVVRHVKDEVFWRKDGTSFPVEYTSTPIHDEKGRHSGTVVIFTDVTESRRTESELEEMHKQLLDTSRQAGMAEVATSVLHNVGNVLNSVNVSSSLVSNQVRKSKVASLTKVVTLLNEHEADIGAFLTSDPKGKLLPHYLGELAEHLVGEQDTILKELHLLHENIEHIKDIVVMQQGYAKISGVMETIKISDLVEDALRMNLGSLQHHGVEVIREFEDVPPMDVEKHKVLQILVNLVRNAKYACDESMRIDKFITLRVTMGDAHVKIAVIDNGIGIPPKNLTLIFNHGFTTRKEGHGFGLHSAALAAMEMGGSLKAESEGLQKGATFTLQLPFEPQRIPHH